MRLLLLIVALCSTAAQAGPGFRRGQRDQAGTTTAFRLLIGGGSDCGTTLVGGGGETITFTRATTQYCTPVSGVLDLKASGVPVLETTGLLIEPAGTNLAIRSSEVDNAAWTKSASATVPVVTANSAECGNAPDGTQTADKVVYPAVSGATSYSLLRQFGVATPTATYTTSLWMKTISGTATLWFGLAGYDTQSSAAVTTTWTRFSVSQAITLDPRSFDIGVNRFEANQSDQPANTICVWGGQVESGAAATTHIPTTTATATRNVVLASAAVLSRLNDAEGCAAATVTVGSTVPASSRVIGFGSSNAALVINSLTQIAIVDGTNTVTKNITSLANRTVRLRATWSGTTSTLTATGETVGSGTYDGTIKGAGSAVYIGSDNGSNAFRGRISDVVLGTSASGCPL